MKLSYPKFESVINGEYHDIIKIENDFLQGLINVGGSLLFDGEFTFTLGGFNSMALFTIVDENTITLQCITTLVDKRKQGSATKLMYAIVHVAKMTNTKIVLFASEVGEHVYKAIPNVVHAEAIIKTNNMSVNKLKVWYMNFGFKAMGYDKKYDGWYMCFE